jgi:hypothetical protein
MSGSAFADGGQSFTAVIVSAAPPLSTFKGCAGIAQGVHSPTEIAGPAESAGMTISRTPAARTVTASSEQIASNAVRHIMFAFH